MFTLVLATKIGVCTSCMGPYVLILVGHTAKAVFFGDGADHYVIMWSWHIMFNIVSALVYLACMENGLNLQLCMITTSQSDISAQKRSMRRSF